MPIPNFNIYISNQLETLSKAMAQVLSTPLESPFDPEIFVVQSHGMSRWVSIELAGYLGVSANYKFYYPNEFINAILKDTQSEPDMISHYVPELMTWYIMRCLPECIGKQGFEPLKKYLENETFTVKHYQLAVRIADLFDQYLLFRPEMIFKWEKGEENHWQAQLWRELITGQTSHHRADLLVMLKKQVNKTQIEMPGLPKRISVFGISALPHFHMEVFSAISMFTEVNLFLVNPCQEYWGVIQSPREIKKNKQLNVSEDEFLYHEQGNRLLASMGTLGRDFFDLLNNYNCNTIELFNPLKEKNLLSCIQSDILNLRDRSMEEGHKDSIDNTDTSVAVHSCHSPMREIEVLYDQLLNMFENDPDLTPKDILVMAPDINTYAPFIQAVFDSPYDGHSKIPYSIADRSMKDESLLIKTVFSIFKLHKSRFKASEVLWILESSSIRRKFGLTGDDLDLIRQWVADVRIRWGESKEDRVHLNLPGFKENTWEAGIERLLLGYAMAGRDEHLFADILPYDDIEGSVADVLGKFLEFLKHFFAFMDTLDASRTLTEWSETLLCFLNTFFAGGDIWERETRAVRAAVSELSDIQLNTGFVQNVPFDLIQHHLSEKLTTRGFGSGFLTGGVTFCAMLPMRSIPFQVICMLGLNHDAYPRQKKSFEFDLIAKAPRPGDRSRRLDDQYIFLESILSARKKLYISYIGQSIRDNSQTPPSVLVSELLDYIENSFAVQDRPITDHVLVKHRLQPFHPDYFKNHDQIPRGFFSFGSEYCLAARLMLHPQSSPQPFFESPLPEPDAEMQQITLKDLYLFFINPSKYLVTRRLGIYAQEGRGEIEDKETFIPGGLDHYILAQAMLQQELSGKDSTAYLKIEKASGRLPHGTVGYCTFDTLHNDVLGFAKRINLLLDDEVLPCFRFNTDIGGFRLSGEITDLFAQHHLLYRYAQITAKDFIKIWLDHLVISLSAPDEIPKKSILAGLYGASSKDRKWQAWELSAVKHPGKTLETLLNLYWQGLKTPLPFFPDTSYRYADLVLRKKQSLDNALIKAREKFEGSKYSPGENNDFYYQLCFGSASSSEDILFDTPFESTAVDFWEPLFLSLKEIK